MAKQRTIFVCQQCDAQFPRWMGRCTECGTWDSLVEQVAAKGTSATGAKARAVGGNQPQALPAIIMSDVERLPVRGSEFSRVLGGGIVPGSVVLVGGEPGAGKCVTGDTRVLDPTTGMFLPITEWRERFHSVLTLDNDQRLGPQTVTAFHEQGSKPIVEVRTRLGRVLRCTATHPVLTPVGWQAVGTLAQGTRIASPRSLPYFGNNPMPEHHVRMIAYALSDGSVLNSIQVTATIPEVVSDLHKLAHQFGMELRTYTKTATKAHEYRFVQTDAVRANGRKVVATWLQMVRQEQRISWAEWSRRANVNGAMLYVWGRGECIPSATELHQLGSAVGVVPTVAVLEARHHADATNAAAQFLEEVGIRWKTAYNKAVPACIFRLPKQQLALFLKIMFTCDGSVYVKTKGNGVGVSYSTISQQLAHDVQHLLLRFGLVAKLRTKSMVVNQQPYTAYEIQILGITAVKHFLHEIGIWGRSEAQAFLAAQSIPIRPSSRTDTIPTGTLFWDELSRVTNHASYKSISRHVGVHLHYHRVDNPLCRTTVATLAKTYPSELFSRLADGDVYWDEIASIEPAGEAPVYDLSVPNGVNFVANDLIIHNSTLLLQVSAEFAQDVGPVLYISAEESPQQIKLRANRLGLTPEQLYILAETNLDTAITHIQQMRPKLVVVDSIQTVYTEEITSAAGSVSQVREGALRLQRVAKDNDISIFLVGHVTKEGAIAGPRVLEHIVDVVLYLEGDRFHQYRLLRGVKNRFGSTNEVGVFEMVQLGMVEVTNPSLVFLAERSAGSPGSTVAVMLEGTRPLLIEVQALTSHTANAQPRRTANGFDPNRLAMIIAVLSKRVGVPLFNQDIYVNIVGGLKVTEPAVDLAVATAIASSFRNQRVDPEMVLVGEIGLSGELRSVSQLERRLNEAAKLGFARGIAPQMEPMPQIGGFDSQPVRSLADAVRGALLGAPGRSPGEPPADHE